VNTTPIDFQKNNDNAALHIVHVVLQPVCNLQKMNLPIQKYVATKQYVVRSTLYIINRQTSLTNNNTKKYTTQPL